jgi:hypothetical protein
MIDRMLAHAAATESSPSPYTDDPAGVSLFNTDFDLLLELLPSLITMWDCWRVHIGSDRGQKKGEVSYAYNKQLAERKVEESAQRRISFKKALEVGENHVTLTCVR